MKAQLLALTLLAAAVFPATADDSPKQNADADPTELKTTPDELPSGVRNFNGMLVGRLAAKDVEKGTFVVKVQAVPRVWRNSKAEAPKSIVGKTVEIEGVFGRFLDVLVVMRKGETIEFECQHDGERLRFPGELLRKVAPYDPDDYPVLPEEFRGFKGEVVAEVLKKDPETLELIVKVDRVVETWKKSTAKKPKSIEGQKLLLAGFWNRKEAYHNIKVGDQIEVGMDHIALRSDHLSVAEFVRKAAEDSDARKAKEQ